MLKKLKKLFHYLKVQYIKHFGGILWTRWNDKYEILVQTHGEVSPKSLFAYVPCSGIVLGAENNPINGYHGYVLEDGWDELGYPYKLGYHTCLQGMGHLTIIKNQSTTGNQPCAFLFPGAQMDLYDSTPDGIVDNYQVTPLNEETWVKVSTHNISELVTAVQNAVKRMHDFLNQ